MNSFLDEFKLKNVFSEKYFKRSLKVLIKKKKQEKTLVQGCTKTLILLRFYIEKFLRVGFVRNAGATPYIEKFLRLSFIKNAGVTSIYTKKITTPTSQKNH